MEPPATDVEEAKESPQFHCDLLDTEMVHKIAEALLPGLASACVDNTIGGLFKTPAAVAVDIRREMVDYLFQRSENFVAESVLLEGGPDGEVSDHPLDIILEIIDDFATSKRNFVSRVSGWLLSERREDRIDDFVQEMELNGFWLLGRREAVSQTLIKNIDIKSIYHCDKNFKSPEELEDHLSSCSFRIMNCMNEGCNSVFSAGQFDYHDSNCPFKILPCEQKCSEIIMRREMDRHCITVCPMKLTKCPFYQVGCQSIIPQSTIEQHRSEDLHSHLVYILHPLHREAPVEDLKKRADELLKLSSIDRLKTARDARSLAYLIKDLDAKLGPIEISVKTNDGEAGGEIKDTKEEETSSSPKKEDSSKPVSISVKTNDGEAGGEIKDTKEEISSSPEKEDSPKPFSISVKTNDGEAGREIKDTKEEETSSSPKKEDSSKPFNGKEERPASPAKHVRSGDSSPKRRSRSSSPKRRSTSSSEEEEKNRSSLDKKEELDEFTQIEKKSQESPVDNTILEGSPAVVEEESTLKKEVHSDSESSSDGAEQI